MKKIIYSALFSLAALQLTAQNIVSNADNATLNSFSKTDEMNRALRASNSRQATGFDNRYEGVKGSPFLYENWSEGSLVLSDSAVVRDRLLFKFDAMNNTIWIKMATGEERILYNRELLALEMYRPEGTKVLVKRVVLPDVTDRNHFALVLFESPRYTLVKDVKKVFRKANLEDKGIVTVGNAYDWFEEVVKYYVRRPSNTYKTFEEFTPKKSKFLGLVPEAQKKAVSQFCKEHDISGKITDAQAASLMKYIDGLK
jgi:hypothetical protein